MDGSFRSKGRNLAVQLFLRGNRKHTGGVLSEIVGTPAGNSDYRHPVRLQKTQSGQRLPVRGISGIGDDNRAVGFPERRRQQSAVTQRRDIDNPADRQHPAAEQFAKQTVWTHSKERNPFRAFHQIYRPVHSLRGKQIRRIHQALHLQTAHLLNDVLRGTGFLKRDVRVNFRVMRLLIALFSHILFDKFRPAGKTQRLGKADQRGFGRIGFGGNLLRVILPQTALFLQDKLPDASPGLISTGCGQFLYPLGQRHVQSPPTGVLAVPGRMSAGAEHLACSVPADQFYDRLSTQLFRLCTLCRPLRIFPSRMAQDAATLPRRPSTACPNPLPPEVAKRITVFPEKS